MDNSGTTPVDQSTEIPSWLEFLNERIEEEREELFSESPSYEIVRDLLVASEDDDTAVSQAVTKFYDLYRAKAGKRGKWEDHGAGEYLNTISVIAFEVAPKLWYTNWRHQRIAEFLIAIKDGAAEHYIEEDPQFVWIGWGLTAAASESWNAGHVLLAVDYYTEKNSKRPEDEWAGEWFSTSGLISKLFQAGCLEDYGQLWISNDLEKAFKASTSGDVKTNAGRQAQVLAAVNHILLAGGVLVEGAKNPLPKWKLQLNGTKWKLWASKIKEVADTVDDTARWDLKKKAKQAYEKMVELYPEAFSYYHSFEDVLWLWLEKFIVREDATPDPRRSAEKPALEMHYTALVGHRRILGVKGDKTPRYEVERRAVLEIWGDKCYVNIPPKTEVKFSQQSRTITMKGAVGKYTASGGRVELHWKPTGMVVHGRASWELRDEGDLVMSVTIDDQQVNGVICLWKSGLAPELEEELIMVGISKIEEYRRLIRNSKVATVGAVSNASWLAVWNRLARG
ncbi:hypothetical protein FCIRC_11530 [Fusarium circinatum]|uniref:Uncharacterized protein n=1 Tax=Fusarium circinatum TaxID=48490 RepID=A0A8H5T539_FUSCI|nr:hypothetical protein FCIRC_11530 [Fusarium circinatum]